ncbi:HIT-like domain-containing protein [Chaetomidium leptoderma]|uniref:Bis(5'-adenosyl)-triphosphatase n=1 Tax=Chaetomidium leptoderma TaxID=669021 RepID=A0AAN6VS33_9PEZI|nr:HIT-like domain-containing protein [Chaetomidium leptoderma]
MSTTTTTSPPQQQKPIFFGPFDVTNQIFLQTPHSFALVNLKPLLPGHVLVCPLRPHRRLTDLSPAELTDLFTAVQRVQRMLARHYFFPSSSPSPLSPPPTTTPPQEKERKKEEGPGPGEENAPPEQRGAFNIALQDGPEAGQTVAHVHVHVIPRIRGSTAKPASTPSDAIYEQMAGEEGNVGGALWDWERDRERAGGHHHHHDEGIEKGGKEEEEGGKGTRPVPGGRFPSIEDAARVARGMGEMEAEARVYRGVLEGMEREEGEEEEVEARG